MNNNEMSYTVDLSPAPNPCQIWDLMKYGVRFKTAAINNLWR